MLHTLLLLTLASQQRTQTLQTVLADAYKTTGVYAVSVPMLLQEQVVPPLQPLTKEGVEAYLKGVVAKLSIPSNLVKLNLPPPPKGKLWTADELIAYGAAEARLFQKAIGEPRSDQVEVIAQALPLDKAKPVVEALDLRPVYVIMLKNTHFGGLWQTTYGEMRLQQTGTRVSGTYTTGDGRIQGTVVGGELRFQWHEAASNTSGYGTFRMAEDGMSFSGPWYNDTQPDQQAGTWTGQRLNKK
jgi:hypothetical protein